MISSQKLHWLAGFLCILLYAVSMYFEYIKHLMPCAICVVQRSIVITLGFFFLLSALQNRYHPKTQRAYSFVTCLLSTAGILTSARHVWLQYHPTLTNNTSCLPGIRYMLQQFSLFKTVHLILKGSGECARITWDFLGLSMPTWLLAFFLGFLLISLFTLLRSDNLK